MKTKFTLLAIFAFACSSLFSQHCQGGGEVLHNQADVDNFVATYSGTCTIINGPLTIRDSVTDISGLSFLTEITGNVNIQNCIFLKTLDGLQNIAAIGGDLLIQNNDSLSSISNFDALTTCERLVITNHNLATSISGFTSLQKINEDFRITANDRLLSISPFTALDSIEVGFYLTNNDSLSTLNCFPALEYISEDFALVENDELYEVGPTSLTYIGEDLWFEDLPSLNTVTAFNNLQTVGSDLRFELTGNITSLSTFSSLTSIHNLQLVNTAISDIDAFANITTANIVTITNCHSLNDLDGFESLINANYFAITHCDGLTNLTGLGELTTCSTFNLSFNDQLTSLDGIGELRDVSTRITISHNPLLTDISGIALLTESPDDIEIENNSALSFCHVSSVCDFLQDNTVTVVINNNDSGCNTALEVAMACNISLPVELENFEVRLAGSTARLDWSTSEEIDNYGFEIQHSLDGSSWEPLGFERGKGSNSVYSFKHEEPQGGNNYYRLKQVDLFEGYSISEIKSIHFKMDDVVAYPSLVENEIHISSAYDGDKELSIFSINGERVFYQAFAGSNNFIQLDNIPSGPYIGKIIGRGVNHSFKLIKR